MSGTYPDLVAGNQLGGQLFTPTFSDLGTHVSDVDADGPWMAMQAGACMHIYGRADVDISADLVSEGFKIVLPSSLRYLLEGTGAAIVLNAVSKGLTVASPGKITDYDNATGKFTVEFESWDGGGVVANVKIDVNIMCAVAGATVPT